ncbi:hypothetical protein I6M49_22290 [Shewanella algae]|uniref:hypothetical protein n=1 Tax=Shewanella algae TaxID=38313 RepID=UPI001AAC9705|nr:hypothetical protein [Shewanella algae]MBO2656176.1 hypothetical protein [Shewanella algae]
MPTALTICLLLLFSAVLAALFWVVPPEDNRQIVVYLIGNLFTLFAGAVAYWVSSSKGSRDKDRRMTALMPGRPQAHRGNNEQ